MEASFYFQVSIDQCNNFIEYIIKGIYGVQDYEITEKDDETKIIQINTDPHIPLINSLPSTIHKEEKVIYDSRDLTNIINDIKEAISDYFQSISYFHENVHSILVRSDELKSIVYQLASDQIISRFAALDNDKFIIVVDPHPLALILKVVDNVLIINIYKDIIKWVFDVDDGYSGILECMNPIWKKWKDNGNITMSIQPPNYV